MPETLAVLGNAPYIGGVLMLTPSTTLCGSYRPRSLLPDPRKRVGASQEARGRCAWRGCGPK